MTLTPRDVAFAALGAALSVGAVRWVPSARADARGAAPPIVAAHDDAPASDDALSAANARLAEQLAACERRAGDSASSAVAPEPAPEAVDTTEVTSDVVPADDEASRDPTPDEWRAMAEEGSFRYRTVCEGAGDYARSEDFARRLGLAPDDAEVVAKAFEAARARTEDASRAACEQLLGVSADGADALGTDTCLEASMTLLDCTADGGSTASLRPVAEVRAGMRASPRDGELGPLGAAMLGVTGEPARIEADLAASLGPAEAKRIVARWGCWGGTGGGADEGP